MPWFMVDDKLHSHRKSVRAGVPAMGLWVLAGSWCADQLSDGFIPDYMVLRLDPGGEDSAAELVRAGLWYEAERDGEKGWQFHQWEERQPTREDVLAKRADARERMARVRQNRHAGSPEVRANSEGTSRGVRSTPALPIPTQPTTTSRKRSDAADAAGFDEFWSRYPRKVGRGQAVKAWRTALRKTDGQTITAGLEAHLPLWETKDQNFIPHASTWLNGERWADTIPAPKPVPGAEGWWS